MNFKRKRRPGTVACPRWHATQRMNVQNGFPILAKADDMGERPHDRLQLIAWLAIGPAHHDRCHDRLAGNDWRAVVVQFQFVFAPSTTVVRIV